MAITPTGAIYKSLNFDGKTSREYGVYITGEAVYNAPEREVEMISIPGRNGAFALDKGRFENIEVKYPAGIFADNETDFADAISDFRNFLCSRKGYCRLTDEYNPNEYRLGIYKSGLEVEPALLRAGEFELLFNCKPQRYLTSGEVKQTIANSGDTITNPTNFDAAPLLEVEGKGNITLGSYTIEIDDVPLGDVVVHEAYTSSEQKPDQISLEIDASQLNAGDTITVSGVQVKNNIKGAWIEADIVIDTLNVTSSSNVSSVTKGITGHRTEYVNFIPTSFSFNYGTAATSSTSTVVIHTESHNGGGAGYEANMTFTYYASYDGVNQINFYCTHTNLYYYKIDSRTFVVPRIMGDSTISVLPVPIYIDLDIGMAYGEYSGEMKSVNSAVHLPAELPTLAPGSNTITFDNTITSLKITPGWWKI